MRAWRHVRPEWGGTLRAAWGLRCDLQPYLQEGGSALRRRLHQVLGSPTLALSLFRSCILLVYSLSSLRV